MSVKIEVKSSYYSGPLEVRSIVSDNSFFSVEINDKVIARMQPIKKSKNTILWYSKQVDDQDFLAEVGKKIRQNFNLTDDSFKLLYEYES